MPAESLEKIAPEGSIQKNIRIPGHLWNRIVDAINFEGGKTFSGFALPALTSHAREIEKKKKKAELED